MTDFTCDFLQVFSDGCGSRSCHSHISNIQLTMTSLPLHKMYISYSYSWSQNCLSKKLAVAVCLTICQFLGCHSLSTIKTSPEPCHLCDGELILCMYVNELVTSTTICMSPPIYWFFHRHISLWCWEAAIPLSMQSSWNDYHWYVWCCIIIVLTHTSTCSFVLVHIFWAFIPGCYLLPM